MSAVRGGVCIRRRWARLHVVVGNLDDGAHPGMDAALESSYADRQFRGPCRWALLACARRNEDNCAKVQTLRRRNRITGDAVQCSDKSASEIGNRRKRMHFTASVLDERGPSNIDVHLARLIPPLERVLSFCQFLIEFIERRVAIADACSIAEYC